MMVTKVNVALFVGLVVLLISVVIGYNIVIAPLWVGLFVPPSGHPLANEIVNTTLNVNSGDSISIPLPGAGTYEAFAKTTGRGMSAVLAYSYTYWQNTSSTDKFGIKWNNETKRSGWSVWYGDGGVNGNLGKTDDTSNLDRIFVIPENALSQEIVVVNSDTNRNQIKIATVNVVVIPGKLPAVPIPPVAGSMVRCGAYSNRDTAQQWGSSDGTSWLDAFGSSNYSLSLSDKYRTYTFPTNLTVINGSGDACRVVT